MRWKKGLTQQERRTDTRMDATIEFWVEHNEGYELTFEEFADSVEPRPSQKRLEHEWKMMIDLAENVGFNTDGVLVYRVKAYGETFEGAVRNHNKQAKQMIADERDRLIELFTQWTNYGDAEHLAAKLKPFKELLDYWWS